MSYRPIFLRGPWCNIIVLNVHAPSEEKVMIQKTVFMRNRSSFFYHFPKYHMKILLGDFNAKVQRERILSNRQLGMRVYISIVMIMVLA